MIFTFVKGAVKHTNMWQSYVVSKPKIFNIWYLIFFREGLPTTDYKQFLSCQVKNKKQIEEQYIYA